jgi:hypothetical protein
MTDVGVAFFRELVSFDESLERLNFRLEALKLFTGEVECEPPNLSLSEFGQPRDNLILKLIRECM